MRKLHLYIIVPTFNGEATVGLLAEQLLHVLGQHQVTLLFVDDASQDNTRDVIRNLAEKHDAILYSFSDENQGQQASVRIGLSMISRDCDYVITMDDDMQNPVSVIPEMVKQIQSGYALVYAISEKDGTEIHIYPPLYRRIGSHLRDRLFESFLNKPAGIQVSSFRIMTQELAAKVSTSEKKFFYFSAEALQYKIKVGNVFYPFTPRHSGRSSYRLLKLIKMYLNIIYTYKLKK